MFLRIVQRDGPSFLEAATLCLLVFSDVIFTSHMIEELKKPYKVWMKMTDLFSFLLLTGAVLATDPSKDNLLEIDVGTLLPLVYREPVFWLLVAVYMFFLCLWNAQCGTYKDFLKKHDKHLLIQPGMVVLFALMCAASFTPESDFTRLFRLATFLLTAAYLLGHKTWLMDYVGGGR